MAPRKNPEAGAGVGGLGFSGFTVRLLSVTIVIYTGGEILITVLCPLRQVSP